MKIDKKLKHKWLKALRSGKYNQGTGILKTNYGGANKSYCCLGVLCDVVNPKGWTGFKDQYFQYKGEIDSSSLPDTLSKKLGISEGQIEKLMSMNDTENKSFNEIASYISRNL